MTDYDIFESLFCSDIASFFLSGLPKEAVTDQVLRAVSKQSALFTLDVIERYSLKCGRARSVLVAEFEHRSKMATATVDLEVVQNGQPIDPKDFN